MVLKSETSFKEYLKKLPDDTIIEYYSDVEYSPFPVILIQEYTRRFQQKSKNEIILVFIISTPSSVVQTGSFGMLIDKKSLFIT